MLSKNKDGMKKAPRDIFMTIGTSSFFHILSSGMSAVWSFFFMGTVPLDVITYKVLAFLFCCAIFSKISLMSLLFFLYWGKVVPLGRLARPMEHFSQAVPWLIVACLLFCFTLSSFIFQFDIQYQNTSEGVQRGTFIINTEGFILACILLAQVIILPFCLMVFACISLLDHLIRHVQQLHSDTCEISNPQVHHEKRIMIMLLTQLLLFTIYIVILVIIFIVEWTGQVSGIGDWSSAVPVFYSLSTSANLIHSYGYLRKISLSLLSKLKGQG